VAAEGGRMRGRTGASAFSCARPLPLAGATPHPSASLPPSPSSGEGNRSRKRRAGLLTALCLIPLTTQAAPRVFSLDQCADQFVVALAPRPSIVGLSPRVLDADSYMRAQAVGLPRRRASSEAILATRPQVVVRSWGGDARLTGLLTREGVSVVQIDGDAADFAGVRANIRRVAAALGEPARGEALIARMDGQIARSRGAWGGRGAIYLTPAGFTAGPQTLIDAVLTAAGPGARLLRRLWGCGPALGAGAA
jgi:iron complex transport system substrate-binding protein